MQEEKTSVACEAVTDHDSALSPVTDLAAMTNALTRSNFESVWLKTLGDLQCFGDYRRSGGTSFLKWIDYNAECNRVAFAYEYEDQVTAVQQRDDCRHYMRAVIVDETHTVEETFYQE